MFTRGSVAGVDLIRKTMTQICWSSTAVVVRGRPDRGRSLTSPVSLQRRMRLVIVAEDTRKVVPAASRLPRWCPGCDGGVPAVPAASRSTAVSRPYSGCVPDASECDLAVSQTFPDLFWLCPLHSQYTDKMVRYIWRQPS